MDTEHHQALHKKILAMEAVSDWIYHDARLNCDGKAPERTAQRIREINAIGGSDALFGMTAAWSFKAYWRFRRAYAAKGVLEVPAILPTEVSKIQELVQGSVEEKRAVVSAQQFVSAMTQDDLEMAEAIFNAAYETSLAETELLMYNVLVIAVNLSNQAYRME